MQTDRLVERDNINEIAPLISVIVPIYNVERYVRKCLDGLKGQTLREIEVICIDDGSTDRSGVIADEYESSEFPIFRVIHTENRGLSATRNRGLDEARAEWIMFVDSDDWVDSRFCELPYKAAIENQADLVIFGFEEVYNRIKRIHRNHNKRSPTGIIDAFMAHDVNGILTWNKLYCCELFRKIRYPEGRAYEDLATTYKLINKSERIMSIEDILYHHVLRKDSISHSHTVRNRKDCFLAAQERYAFFVSCGYPTEKTGDFLLGCSIGLLSVSRPSTDELYISAKDIVDSIEGIPRSLTIKQKIALILWRIDTRLFYVICRMTGRLKKYYRDYES